jgi:hypothetical protein
MDRMPKYSNWRPDFEAPGPHVTIEDREGIFFEDSKYRDPDEQGDDDDDFTTYRYYESEKILGKLYRAIDERKIFQDIKDRASRHIVKRESTVIDSAWDYVQRVCRGIQWEHLVEWARDIRDM